MDWKTIMMEFAAVYILMIVVIAQAIWIKCLNDEIDDRKLEKCNMERAQRLSENTNV